MSDFDFLGFDPSKELKTASQRYLKQLIKISSAVVGHDAYIVKTTMGLFEGSVKIHTPWDSLSVSAADRAPDLVLEKMYKQMKEKIIERLRARNPILPSSRYWFDKAEEDLRPHRRKAS